MVDLVKPKSLTVTSLDGETKEFFISRMPAVQGREIVAKYPMSALPKIGDYAVNEETMLKMMGFVAVAAADGLRLTTKALVDNHVSDWEMLAQLEKGMLAYNTSFFGNGTTWNFLGNLKQTLKAFLIETLTDSLAVSSKAGKPPSTN